MLRNVRPPRVLALAAGVLFAAQAVGAAPRGPQSRSDRPARLLGILCQPGELPGGKEAKLVLVLNRPAPRGGVAVALSSAQPEALKPPPRLVIPAGVQRLGFTLATT